MAEQKRSYCPVGASRGMVKARGHCLVRPNGPQESPPRMLEALGLVLVMRLVLVLGLGLGLGLGLVLVPVLGPVLALQHPSDAAHLATLVPLTSTSHPQR